MGYLCDEEGLYCEFCGLPPSSCACHVTHEDKLDSEGKVIYDDIIKHVTQICHMMGFWTFDELSPELEKYIKGRG